VQAFIRVAGTLIALIGVVLAAQNTPDFTANIQAAGDGYLSLFSGGILPSLGFIAGFASAAIGFGLGQPQIVSRYMAGRSPAETQSARWIYIGFLQGTWIAMTVFGIVLRGVMPNIADPETGLMLFFRDNMGFVITGIIAADFFATIASTANGLLVAITQTLRRNLLSFLPTTFTLRQDFLAVGVGIVTIILSLSLPSSVSQIILSSVSLMGAGLGGAVMIRIMGWRCDARSLLIAMVAGMFAALAWKTAGYELALNESLIGLVVTLGVNRILVLRNGNVQINPPQRLP